MFFSASLTFGSVSIRTHGQDASMEPIVTSAEVSRRWVDSEELPDISCLLSSLLTILLKGRQVLIRSPGLLGVFRGGMEAELSGI